MFVAHVTPPTALLNKRHPAMFTLESTIIRMNSHMLSQITLSRIAFEAHLTLKVSSAGMLQHVVPQLGRGEELHIAFGALVSPIH